MEGGSPLPAGFHEASPPRAVLVVVTRRIGDVLLATPVLRSVKATWPECGLDVLALQGTESIIAANADVRRVLTIPARPGFLEHLLFVMKIARRYDLALSLLPGDRPTLYAYCAGRWRAGVLYPTRKAAWKRHFLDRWVPFDGTNTHTVLAYLALTESLGIASRREVVVSWSEQDAKVLEPILAPPGERPCAVLHPYPRFRYKMWHRAGWIDVARWLEEMGFRIILTGGGDSDELAYVADLARDMPRGTLNLAGKLSLGSACCLVARCATYVGLDTALTHAAAAAGVPTVVLFGPTDPRVWGPWPKGYSRPEAPWKRIGHQCVGRVRLLQGSSACAPCNKEGCERHVESDSDCLLTLPADKVIAAIRAVIA